jgi:Na+/proline symporter
VSLIDWVIVAAFLGVLVVLGVVAQKRASGSLDNFFVAGRALPWWMAGTSMLATSFASDTPLHTTRMIREHGLQGAWFYWGGILGGVGVAFFFARLWRRAGVVTDAELLELRYGGRAGAALRLTTGLFRGALLETITLSWVILGMTKIVQVLLDLGPDSGVVVVTVLIAIALLYTVTSGLWGVVVTDVFEFGIAMIGAIMLAGVALVKVGGPSGLEAALTAQGKAGALEMLPALEGTTLPALAIGVYLGVQWWSTPYVDGSGQRAQRFLASKNEGHALVAGVWNMTVQWVLRSWPWYIAALCSMVLYPALADHERAYPQMIVDLLPVGFRAVMVASFFAAFMSTVDSLLNLSASYVTNDVYRRFVKKKASDKHYVRAGRVVSVVLAGVAAMLALRLPSMLDAFRLKMELMSGLGCVALLRWFWWRVNGVSELATLATSLGVAVALNLHPELGVSGAGPSALRLLIVVGCSLVVTIGCALLTRPEPKEKLVAFYERVRPPRALWRAIAAEARPSTEPPPITGQTVGQYAVCVGLVFSGMFGIGKLVLAQWLSGFALTGMAVTLGIILWKWVLSSALSEERSPAAAEVAPGNAPAEGR